MANFQTGGDMIYLPRRRRSDGPPAASGWNSLDKSATITLSNNNLTATSSGTSDSGIRSTTSKTSGKLYVEFTFTSGTGVNTGVGVTTGAQSLATVGPTPTNALLVYNGSGNIYFNNVSQGKTIGGVTVGAVVCLALDLDNQRGWFRKDAGNWNGDAAANPATNTNGINISAIFPANAAFLVWAVNFNGMTATINTSGPFAQPVPSGFIAWG